jgi:chaperone modulatory protein CbpM
MTAVGRTTRVRSAVIPLPERSQIYLSSAELATVAGIRPSTLERLVRLGVVEAADPDSDRFTAATAVRLRRMLRLHDDLGVNFIGAAIIADLLERLERLERDASHPRGEC